MEYLFVRGPFHGEWRSVDTLGGVVLYEEGHRPFSEMETLKRGTYVMRRLRHPSWRITLQVFLHEGDQLRPGDVMPGWVVGQAFRSSPLPRGVIRHG